MKRRQPQLALRLDAGPTADPLAVWHDQARLAYLGNSLTLRLATGRESVERIGADLHVTLPPEATARQIRDACEAWLREEAAGLIEAALQLRAAAHHSPLPRWRLSFAERGHWAKADVDGVLRFHWRLVEQPAEVIEQAVARALAALPAPAANGDLFAAAAGGCA
jgi:predicted metal-dependent hydrolase